MKRCPHCAEQIQDDAQKCRFCGEWIERHTPEAPRGPPTRSSSRARIIGAVAAVLLLGGALVGVVQGSKPPSAAAKITKFLKDDCDQTLIAQTEHQRGAPIEQIVLQDLDNAKRSMGPRWQGVVGGKDDIAKAVQALQSLGVSIPSEDFLRAHGCRHLMPRIGCLMDPSDAPCDLQGLPPAKAAALDLEIPSDLRGKSLAAVLEARSGLSNKYPDGWPGWEDKKAHAVYEAHQTEPWRVSTELEFHCGVLVTIKLRSDVAEACDALAAKVGHVHGDPSRTFGSEESRIMVWEPGRELWQLNRGKTGCGLAIGPPLSEDGTRCN